LCGCRRGKKKLRAAATRRVEGAGGHTQPGEKGWDTTITQACCGAGRQRAVLVHPCCDRRRHAVNRRNNMPGWLWCPSPSRQALRLSPL
jgi:hypothetical protein